ncbi:MAG: glycine--tRNA ligase subunit beta [Collinsella sp.]
MVASPAFTSRCSRTPACFLPSAVVRPSLPVSPRSRLPPGCHVDTPKKVFEEVINLCEWPTVLVGTFDEEFLKVPHEIICESMLTNQRYFPIYDGEGKLTREFVIVSNSKPENAERVIDGNERVVRARLDDAKFFYEEDLKISLDEFRERLAKVAFQEKLGSVLAKSERIEQLALAIAREATWRPPGRRCRPRRAPVQGRPGVNAVVEFTSQQGVMGGYYATRWGRTKRSPRHSRSLSSPLCR